jgi:hypothetical protein
VFVLVDRHVRPTRSAVVAASGATVAVTLVDDEEEKPALKEAPVEAASDDVQRRVFAAMGNAHSVDRESAGAD